MAYVWLAFSIIAEVIATSTLKATEEFTRPLPSIAVVVAYVAAFYSLTMVLRSIPVGVAYAIWCGLGIVLVNLLAIWLYKQVPDLPAIIGMALIILGCVVINLYSKTVAH